MVNFKGDGFFTQEGSKLVVREFDDTPKDHSNKMIDDLIKRGYVKRLGNILLYGRPQYRLLVYLMKNAVGMGNAVSGFELSKYMFNTKLNDVKVRSYVRLLRREGFAIGSSPSGYFIATDTKELIEGMQFMLIKTLDEMKTLLFVHPPFKDLMHDVIGYTYKNVDKSHEGQMTVDYTAIDTMFTQFVKRFAKQEDAYDFQTYEVKDDEDAEKTNSK